MFPVYETRHNRTAGTNQQEHIAIIVVITGTHLGIYPRFKVSAGIVRKRCLVNGDPLEGSIPGRRVINTRLLRMPDTDEPFLKRISFLIDIFMKG